VLISYFIGDVLKQTLREEQADEQLFTFLLKLANELNNTTNLKSFPLEFLANLITQLGVSPTTIEHATGFNMEEGVFISSGNGATTKDEKMASYLNELFTTLKAPERNLDKDALEILLSYMRIHLPLFDNSRSISIIRDVIYD
jgi:DNA repair protein RecO (recombination protein O)